MSQRPTFRPYNEYQQRQRNIVNHKDEFGPKLFKQMVVGFVCAGLLGLILLILGAVFMKDALKSEYSISVMLCVFGMGKNQLVRVLFLCNLLLQYSGSTVIHTDPLYADTSVWKFGYSFPDVDEQFLIAESNM